MSRQTLQEFCTAQKRPELLVEWDLERNAPLTPDDVTFASHKKVWWCCRNGHSWQTAVYTRSGGAGCPYCSGRSPRSVRGSILSECVPALADEWDSEKNAPLTPSQVTVGSHRVVWWHCEKGHDYQTSVKLRVRGSGCPYCAGRAVLPEENSLAAIAPELLSEWDTEKNAPLTPEQVLAGTHRKIWWRCKKGHSWQAAAVSRIRNRTECPVCAGKKVISGENDLATVFPQLAAQWDTEKNGSLTPEAVLSLVAAHYGFSSRDLRGKKRDNQLVEARQMAMYLCRELLGESYPSLGRIFGGKDHSTVMHAVKKIRENQVTNKDMHILVTELTQRCLNRI